MSDEDIILIREIMFVGVEEEYNQAIFLQGIREGTRRIANINIFDKRRKLFELLQKGAMILKLDLNN